MGGDGLGESALDAGTVEVVVSAGLEPVGAPAEVGLVQGVGGAHINLTHWQPDQLFADPYRIPIKPDVPTGPVPLTIGMYDLATMQRLPVLTPDGEPAGDNVYLTDVIIRSP